MRKIYKVSLTESEIKILKEVIKKLKGTSQKVRRAQILLKSSEDWTDKQIAEAFLCRRQTVENLRKRFVERGFEEALEGRKRTSPPTEKLLDGKQEAEIIAMRLGEPPKGYGSWSLRLLSKRVVELSIVESISHETIRKTLKKMA